MVLSIARRVSDTSQSCRTSAYSEALMLTEGQQHSHAPTGQGGQSCSGSGGDLNDSEAECFSGKRWS